MSNNLSRVEIQKLNKQPNNDGKFMRWLPTFQVEFTAVSQQPFWRIYSVTKDYQVADQINHGGFGHIFKLVQRRSKRVYALKVLDRTRKGEEIKIKNEINIHQSLKNRYILQLNNKFHDEINFYMVLEYCEQGDLFTYMTNNYPNLGFPIEIVQRLTQQIAKGISYLHKQDIIHGDIKPSNILLNQKLEIKICDFGLSTKRKNKQKVNGAKGTLNYLAPQCIFPYDEKVDIWAFGVLVFFIATGTLPFQIVSYKQLTEVLTEEKLKNVGYPQKIPHKLKDLLQNIFVFDPTKRCSIQDVLNHPFFTGAQLELKQTQKNESIPRMRSHTSTTVESIKKYDDAKNTLRTSQQMTTHSAKRSRLNSQNKDYIPVKIKESRQNYMTRILEKKTKMLLKNNQNYNKQNKQNNFSINNKKTNQNTQKHKTQGKVKPCSMKTHIQPLKTDGMVIKPIIEKNCVTKIDQQGICRRREEMNEEGQWIFKQIKISPDGNAIFMKLKNVEKFYRIDTLPQKYYKEYENCRRIVQSVKNHTPKLQFSRKITIPTGKEMQITVMFSGKVIGAVNGVKIESTQKELNEDFVTFADNNQAAITEQEQAKHELKCLYHKLMSL